MSLSSLVKRTFYLTGFQLGKTSFITKKLNVLSQPLGKDTVLALRTIMKF
jgi:hypothetical protein